jgi:hypothetical protein
MRGDRRFLGLVASALAFGSMPSGSVAQSTLPSFCEDLATEPVRYGVQYNQVQEVWQLGGCTGCHNSAARMGNLLLETAETSILNLIGFPSYENENAVRVIPGNPDGSLLIQVLNCVPPGSHEPMPPSMTGTRIPLQMRALVYDWIAEGAKGADEDGNPVSDVLFRDAIESDRFQRFLGPN